MTAIDIFVQHESFISVPERESKPRITGLTCLIDTGLATGKFEDVIRSHHPFIDYVKFGWGTALVTTELERKIACLRQHDVDFFFGGTLFEKAAHQRKLDLYYNFLKRWNCRNVETLLTHNRVITCRVVGKWEVDFCFAASLVRQSAQLAGILSVTLAPRCRGRPALIQAADF